MNEILERLAVMIFSFCMLAFLAGNVTGYFIGEAQGKKHVQYLPLLGRPLAVDSITFDTLHSEIKKP